jgi:hypothetical protein
LSDQARAELGNEPVNLLIVIATNAHVLPQKTYFVQNAYNFLIRRRSGWCAGVLCIENQAAEGAGQLAQREDIPMFL